ncbi:hypothetical protein AUJ68_06455 [Candidatus Woesearchaeota archaeon CG1_02_57_44]|nr:MAG: hypothetical protein AUJ68_06455 [Candidatus Woesearchaeota archaeon CG1_02_57_44]
MRQAYSKKASGSLAAAKLLLEHELFAEAIALAYYAMYHKTTALFWSIGLRCKSHRKTTIILQQVFSIDPAPLEEAREQRISRQYYADITATAMDTASLIDTAVSYLATMDALMDSMNEEGRDACRKKAQLLADSG